MLGLTESRLRKNMIKKTFLNEMEEKVIKGFTLIELLVVISIIGLLSTLLLANFNSTRARARDAERKMDLKNIQTALRLYYNDFNKYPENDDDGRIKGCETGGTSTCEWSTRDEKTSFSTDKDTYMSTLPGDPSSDRVYIYTQIDDDTYTLEACLENKSDKDCGGDCTSSFGVEDDAPEGCIYTVQP